MEKLVVEISGPGIDQHIGYINLTAVQTNLAFDKKGIIRANKAPFTGYLH